MSKELSKVQEALSNFIISFQSLCIGSHRDEELHFEDSKSMIVSLFQSVDPKYTQCHSHGLQLL